MRSRFSYVFNVRRSVLTCAYPGCHYVADTRDGFENEQADTQWLFDVFFPQTALTTCKAIIFIIDNDNRFKKELEGQSVGLRKLFDVHYCFGLDEVESVLKQYRD